MSEKIGSIARRFGVHPDTIRRLEKRGFISPGRDRLGHRRYTKDDEQALRSILTTQISSPPRVGRPDAVRAAL